MILPQREQFESRKYRKARRVALENREDRITERQFLILLHCGIIRTDDEIDAYDEWERTQ